MAAEIKRKMASFLASYWRVFRLIFIMFSLHLIRDAFYQWDGFRYYSSFSEFLTIIALVNVIWIIVAAFVGLLVWLLLVSLEWLSLRAGLKIRIEHLLLFMLGFVCMGISAVAVKRFIWSHIQTSFQIKLIVFLVLNAMLIFLIWLFREKTEKLERNIQASLTPVVWLFGIWFVISVPIVTYYALLNKTETELPKKISGISVTEKDRPNIILVTFDALTARDMSVYGYHRPTTPFIKEWANTASLFTNLQAESNFTTPTTASLMTGKRVWTHQAYHLNGSGLTRNSIENLPLVLKNHGYFNMAFTANPYASVKNLDIADSFEIAPPVTDFTSFRRLSGKLNLLLYKTFGDKIKLYNWILNKKFIIGAIQLALTRDYSVTSNPAEKVFSGFMEIVDTNLPEPFFAWIHLWPPHFYYLPPEHFKGMFDTSKEMRTFKSQNDVGFAGFVPDNQETVDIIRARYDEFIRYCDKQFEEFISQFSARKMLKNTVIILSSDHGESFEHDFIQHGGPHLYEQVTHIPLIIKEPGQTEGRVISNLVEQIDLPSTILDLADIPAPSWMEGRSLVPLMHGMELNDRPAFSMYLAKNPVWTNEIKKGTIAVWEDDYKLIHYLKDNKSLLFNLKEDPAELNNLFDKEPEISNRLVEMIRDNLSQANDKIRKGKKTDY